MRIDPGPDSRAALGERMQPRLDAREALETVLDLRSPT
jgi:hypothetical protein